MIVLNLIENCVRKDRHHFFSPEYGRKIGCVILKMFGAHVTSAAPPETPIREIYDSRIARSL